MNYENVNVYQQFCGDSVSVFLHIRNTDISVEKKCKSTCDDNMAEFPFTSDHNESR